MKRPLDHYDTNQLSKVERIDDLLLLPRQPAFKSEEIRALQVRGYLDPDPVLPLLSGFLLYQKFWGRYVAERVGLHEPEWVKDLPVAVQTSLQLDYALQEEEPYAIMLGLSRTGLSYMVLDDGVCASAGNAFRLHRLSDIKQLGFLQAPNVNKAAKGEPLSKSNRFIHVLDVMVLFTLMAHNLGLDEVQRNTGRTAALTHDAATPAGGDSVKYVAPAELDEDANYGLLLKRPEAQAHLAKYNIPEDLLLRTINNEGLLGEMLDVADKLAYVARDLHYCMHHIEMAAREGQDGLVRLLEYLHDLPDVCSLWDSVVAVEGRLVFTSIPRLTAFLRIRLLLFRELYYHPSTRFGEFLISQLLVKLLWEEGELTRDNLMEMTDTGLKMILTKRFGEGIVNEACSSDFSSCKSFNTKDEALAFQQELEKQGVVFSVIDDMRFTIKTGTHFLVMTDQGPLSIKEAEPEIARGLEEMATMFPMVHVRYLEESPRLPTHELNKLYNLLHPSKN